MLKLVFWAYKRLSYAIFMTLPPANLHKEQFSFKIVIFPSTCIGMYISWGGTACHGESPKLPLSMPLPKRHMAKDFAKFFCLLKWWLTHVDSIETYSGEHGSCAEVMIGVMKWKPPPPKTNDFTSLKRNFVAQKKRGKPSSPSNM